MGKTAREIHIQTIYVECSPNQFKKLCSLMLNALQINYKIIPYRPFHQAIDETLRIPEQCWPFLYLNFTRVLQFSSNSPDLKDSYNYCMCTDRQLFL